MDERVRNRQLAGSIPELTARRVWWRRDATASSILTASCCVCAQHETHVHMCPAQRRPGMSRWPYLAIRTTCVAPNIYRIVVIEPNIVTDKEKV